MQSLDLRRPVVCIKADLFIERSSHDDTVKFQDDSAGDRCQYRDAHAQFHRALFEVPDSTMCVDPGYKMKCAH